jgi:hypothetical protein
MSESLKRALRADIACHEASLFTTPHLSRIHHAEVALLALLEERSHPAAVIADGHVPADPAARSLEEVEAFRRSVVLDETEKQGPRQHARFLADPSFVRKHVVPLRDTLTLVDVLDKKGPL